MTTDEERDEAEDHASDEGRAEATRNDVDQDEGAPARSRGADEAASATDPEEEGDEPSAPGADDGDPEPAAGSDDDADEDDALGRDRARKAAKALGVGPEDEEEQPVETAAEAEETEASKAPRNRAERRRALAVKRRQGRTGDSETPRDRNARTRQEQAEKRRKAASGEGEGGDGSEVSDLSLAVDDALARTGDAAGRWLRHHWRWIQWVLAAGLVGGVGVLGYVWRSGQTTAASSDVLLSAVAAEQARVLPPEKDSRSEEEKKRQSDRVFYASYDARDKEALERYQRASADRPGSGPAILAKLGVAGVKLDRREWDEAIAGYEAVLASKLAEADLDVKGRALEGLAFALEGKKDLDKASATFDKLGELADPMFKVLAKYHRARLTLAKGDKDGAKKQLEELRKEIETNELEVKRVSHGAMSPYAGVRTQVEQALRRIDPNAVAPKFVPNGPGGAQITPEQIQRLLEQKGLQPGLPSRDE